MQSEKYKQAGVNIDNAQLALKNASPFIKNTFNDAVILQSGSYGSLYDLKDIMENYQHPVLVQSVDGIGTKLVIARMANRFESVGFDIVNHCCNDILCMGARAINFLDYIAVEHLEPRIVTDIIKGIATACMKQNIALVGGETAEMPGVYIKNEFDIAGMITGVVEKDKIINGQSIIPGDLIIGLKSDGLHTNGYSLARKVLFENLQLNIDSYIDELQSTLQDALLKVHKDYSQTLLSLLDEFEIKGLVHITGGGLIDNIPRILPKNCNAKINKNSWELPAIFKLIQEGASIDDAEMARTFNIGIGMVIIVGKDTLDPFIERLRTKNEVPIVIGEIVEGDKKTVLL
ncbi:MAG: phosphoribosylformylglycinamidine cyclo-ligase [Nitrospinota bacterium]